MDSIENKLENKTDNMEVSNESNEVNKVEEPEQLKEQNPPKTQIDSSTDEIKEQDTHQTQMDSSNDRIKGAGDTSLKELEPELEIVADVAANTDKAPEKIETKVNNSKSVKGKRGKKKKERDQASASSNPETNTDSEVELSFQIDNEDSENKRKLIQESSSRDLFDLNTSINENCVHESQVEASANSGLVLICSGTSVESEIESCSAFEDNDTVGNKDNADKVKTDSYQDHTYKDCVVSQLKEGSSDEAVIVLDSDSESDDIHGEIQVNDKVRNELNCSLNIERKELIDIS